MEEAGHDQALGRGLARKAVGRVGLRCDAAGRERTLAVPLQRVDGGHPPLGVGERAPRPFLRPPCRDDLTLGARRLGEVARQLGAARMLLQDGDAPWAALALGPEIERPAPEVGRVAVGVDRGTLADRLHQRVERAGGVSCGDPVPGDLPPVAAAARELFGELAVERSAAQPGDVLVQRIARQRMAECGLSRLGLDDQPAGEKLCEACLGLGIRDEAELESRPGDRGHLGHPPGIIGEAGRPHEHRVAHRSRQRDVAVDIQLQAVRGGTQPPGRAQRRGQLLDEEGRPAGTVEQGPGQPGGRW